MKVNTSSPPGTGDVVGPASSTDNAVARFDTTTGKLIQNSAFVVDDSGYVSSFGGQIAFPSTQAASAGANTLDDYEEGTWTPVVDGTATYTAQVGIYCKIGRLVHISFYLAVNAIGTGTTSKIAGFPFTANATNTKAGTIAYWTGSATSLTWLGIYVINSTTYSAFTGTAAAVTGVTNFVAFWANGADCLGAIDYQV